MALFDALFEFSDNQDISSSAQSTNILDMQAADLEMGAGEPIWLNIRLSVAASSGTSLTCVLHASSTTDIDAGTEALTNHTLWSSGAIGQTYLTAGKWITRIPLPVDFDADRYIGIQYTASGSLTGCRVNAWFDHGPQSSYDTQVAASNI